MSEGDQIIAIFESHRRVPGAAYEESHFLDYLLSEPKKNRAVYDSFSGLRRFNAFVDTIQLTYSVFFSLKDREANYSLDNFVARVDELRNSPRSSLTSFKNHVKGGFGWQVVALGNVILLITALWLRYNTTALLILSICAVCLNILVLSFYIRHRQYNARLYKQLLALAAARANNSVRDSPSTPGA